MCGYFSGKLETELMLSCVAEAVFAYIHEHHDTQQLQGVLNLKDIQGVVFYKGNKIYCVTFVFRLGQSICQDVMTTYIQTRRKF